MFDHANKPRQGVRALGTYAQATSVACLSNFGVPLYVLLLTQSELPSIKHLFHCNRWECLILLECKELHVDGLKSRNQFSTQYSVFVADGKMKARESAAATGERAVYDATGERQALVATGSPFDLNAVGLGG